MRIALAAAVLAAAQPAMAQTGIPSPWVLETDESQYPFIADPIPPGPVDGVYAHGISGDGGVGWSDTLDVPGISEECSGRLRLEYAVPRPTELPEHIAAEFWFFRSGDQVLYLQKLWLVEAVEDCVGRVVLHTNYARAIIRGESRTEFYARPEGRYEVRTVSSEIGVTGKIPGALLYPSADQRQRNRGIRSDEGRGPAGEVCYDESIAFHFATQCYIERRGPWRGYLSYSQSQDDTGDNISEYRILELDTHAQLDGRLFEWDRTITFSGAQ